MTGRRTRRMMGRKTMGNSKGYGLQIWVELRDRRRWNVVRQVEWYGCCY